MDVTSKFVWSELRVHVIRSATTIPQYTHSAQTVHIYPCPEFSSAGIEAAERQLELGTSKGRSTSTNAGTSKQRNAEPPVAAQLTSAAMGSSSSKPSGSSAPQVWNRYVPPLSLRESNKHHDQQD